MNAIFTTRPATEAEIKAGEEFERDYLEKFNAQKEERAKLHNEIIAERKIVNFVR